MIRSSWPYPASLTPRGSLLGRDGGAASRSAIYMHAWCMHIPCSYNGRDYVVPSEGPDLKFQQVRDYKN